MKFVPTIVYVTVELMYPNAGVMVVRTGAGWFTTVKAFSRVVSPPLTVTTLMFQNPRDASRGMKTVPLIRVAVTEVRLVVISPVDWFRNSMVVNPGWKLVPVRVKATVVFRVPVAGVVRVVVGGAVGTRVTVI
jgi:hypothetical protein